MTSFICYEFGFVMLIYGNIVNLLNRLDFHLLLMDLLTFQSAVDDQLFFTGPKLVQTV